MISLVDNTGEAKSGILIKGEDHTEKTLPVGTKVVVSLRYAEYDNYQGLPQLLKATVFATEEKAEDVYKRQRQPLRERGYMRRSRAASVSIWRRNSASVRGRGLRGVISPSGLA